MIIPPKKDGWMVQSGSRPANDDRVCEEGSHGRCTPCEQIGVHYCPDNRYGASPKPANDNLHIDDLRGLPGYVYLGSPYSKYPDGLDAAALEVTKAAAKLMSRGVAIFCPIAHSHAIGTAGHLDNLDWVFWQFQDQPLMDRASALVVLMMAGWQESVGLTHEISTFADAGKPIVYVRPEDL